MVIPRIIAKIIFFPITHLSIENFLRISAHIEALSGCFIFHQYNLEIRLSIIKNWQNRLVGLPLDEFISVAELVSCEERESTGTALFQEYISTWQNRLEGLTLEEFLMVAAVVRCNGVEGCRKTLCKEYIRNWQSRLKNFNVEDLLIAGGKVIPAETSGIKNQMGSIIVAELRERINVLSSEKLYEIAISLEKRLASDNEEWAFSPFLRAFIEFLQKGKHLYSPNDLKDIVIFLQNYSEIEDYYNVFSSFLKLPVETDDRNQRIMIQEFILKDIPEYFEPGLTDFQKVILLRTWVHNNGKFSSEKLLIESNPDYNFYTRGPAELFTHFMFETGGAWCGGFAYFLQQIYELFGYESYTVNMGILGSRITHVTTLVKICDEGTTLHSIQDPFFDLSYMHQNGKPLDYFQLLNLIASGFTEDVVISEGENRDIDFIVGSDENLQDYGWFDINPTVKRKYRNRIIYRAKVSIKTFDEYFKVTEKLSALGYSPKFLSLFLKSFSIHRNVDEARELLDRAQDIIIKYPISPPDN